MIGDEHVFALRARLLFPVSGPPIPGGILTIRGPRIVAVGENLSGDAPIDLGDVAIVPGLINAHTHLEFSDLDRPLGQPGEPLPTWIRRVIAYRQQSTANASKAINRGLLESVSHGVTAVGEIATTGWNGTTRPAMDVVLFRELIGLAKERIEPLLEMAEEHLSLSWDADSITTGLSPHAPYTVHPELLNRATALAAQRKMPVAMHVAESAEELELLRTGKGPFRTLLGELGVWREGVIPCGVGPIQYLQALVAAPRTLVIHGNYLDDDAIAFCAQHRDRLAVVYCPRTHHYFGHAPYPLHDMLSAGVTLCVGTDSRASNPDLSLFEELRFIAANHPQVSPPEVLQLGTYNGAKMLRNVREHGVLQPGAYANLAIIDVPNRSPADPHELLFASESRVKQTWWRGRQVSPTAGNS
jgi:cytosine/adenosine deaminase-related metal-dependent hydrolase